MAPCWQMLLACRKFLIVVLVPLLLIALPLALNTKVRTFQSELESQSSGGAPLQRQG